MSKEVQTMFDHIAGRYDFLNRFLSLRRDVAWRRRCVRYAGPAHKILDLCGGTGDLILAHQHLWNRQGFPLPQVQVIGDFSLPMLLAGRGKKKLPPLVQMDALKLPLCDGSMDLVLCGFGLRNLDHLSQGFAEIKRILEPQGRLVVLELFHPSNVWSRFFYGLLAPVFIPLIGAFFSHKRGAYQYLVESVKRFVTVSQFCSMAAEAGFETKHVSALDGGIAHLVILDRQEAS